MSILLMIHAYIVAKNFFLDLFDLDSLHYVLRLIVSSTIVHHLVSIYHIEDMYIQTFINLI